MDQRLDKNRILVGTRLEGSGRIDDPRHARASHGGVHPACLDNYRIAEITRDHFAQAALFADSADTGLRAGDALHLAIAKTLGATVWTLDKQMNAAGPLVGVASRLV